MAGYIMTIDSLESLDKCIKSGTYSTVLGKPRNGNWGVHHEGTFADYLSMEEGNHIYFFFKRKIYGIGELVNIGDDCKYLNYFKADIPKNYSDDDYSKLSPLLEEGNTANRCLCLFKPSPYFFKKGIDMDDVLASNPQKFKMLRAMWKVSFIKIDDEEDSALMDIILKRNEEELYEQKDIYEFSNSHHSKIEHKIKQDHRLNTYNILLNAKDENKIKHEMAIEAHLCEMLKTDNEVFGKWDYISHQVIASPFKPIDYMDKMDIFGYRYIKGYNTISKYLIIEIKKDAASVEVIDQVMKYVDWVTQEYAFGDYSMVEAYIVASDFPEEVIEKNKKDSIRYFTKGNRPTESCEWSDCTLVSYNYENDEIEFNKE